MAANSQATTAVVVLLLTLLVLSVGSSRVPALTKDKRCQTGFRSLFVFGVHVLGGHGHGRNRGVEIHAPLFGNLFAGDAIAGPSFDCPIGATFDTRHLNITSYWIAGHPEVMFQRRFGSI